MKIAGYRFIALLAVAALVATGAGSGSALADPPSWAPAHGHRAKHKHKHKHRHEYEHHHHHYHYDRDRYTKHGRLPFGIDLGLCNRDLLGSVLGGAAGGVVGSQIGKGSDRTAATIGGTIVGVLIGGGIGRSMDRVDYGCLGRTLEHALDSQPVIWRNPGGARYQVIPHGGYENRFGRYCREYTTIATIGGRTERIYGTACRQPDGAWELVS